MDNSKFTVKLNALVIGSTGATGREIVNLLIKSEKWGKIILPVRRKISKIDELSEEESKKLILIQLDNLDFLSKEKEEIKKKFGDNLTEVIEY